MHKLKRSLHLLALTISVFMGSQNIFAQAGHSLDLEKIEQNLHIEKNVINILEQHQKLHNYLMSYAEYLLFEINAGRILNGEHLNIIKNALSIYGVSSLGIYNSIQNHETKLERVSLKLQLTESYFAIFKAYTDDSLLRKVVSDQQEFSLNNLLSFEELKEILLSKKALEDLEEALKTTNLKNDNKILSETIEKTISYELIKNEVSLTKYFKVKGHFQDRINSFVTTITNGLSRAFGTLIGGIEWRTGYLYQDLDFQALVESKLNPLDIIFEKKSFKLTDKTIPGNWGHTAVWLGTKEQLVQLGLWDKQELAPFREKIEKGQSIFEMRKWGTQFDSIENFLNLDEIAITRVKDIKERSQTDILKVYQLLADQFEKTYDFGFDAMATTKITCTEVIMLSYGAINWPADKVLGRLAITPNNMAEIAVWNNSPVDFVAYFRAKELHEVQNLSKAEFAKVLDYRVKPKMSNEFEKVNRVCKNKRYRRHGAMRMRLECHDEFEQINYLGPTQF